MLLLLPLAGGVVVGVRFAGCPPLEDPDDPPDLPPGGDVPPVIWAAVAPAGSASATAVANARNQNRLFARVLSMR